MHYSNCGTVPIYAYMTKRCFNKISSSQYWLDISEKGKKKNLKIDHPQKIILL